MTHELRGRLKEPAAIYKARGQLAALQVLTTKYPSVLTALPQDLGGADPGLVTRALIGAVLVGDQAEAVRLAQRISPRLAARPPFRVSPLATLQEFCTLHGCFYSVVLPSQHIEIPAASPHSLSHSYDTEAAVFASLPFAQFIPDWDFIIGDDDTILTDTGYLSVEISNRAFATAFVEPLNSLIHYAPREEVFVDEEVLFLSAPTDNVGHWMIDFLPRLNGLKYIPNPDVKVVVPSGMPKRYLEMLELFGISGERLMVCDRSKLYRFRMCHTYRPGQSMPPNPAHVAWVRNAFIRGMTPAVRPGKRVFLSRTSVGTRMVANHQEFKNFLNTQNFLSADPANLTLAEQAELLGDAEIVAGVFGSNLLAIYFAPPGCNVIVLTQDVTEDPVLAHMSFMLGMRHQYLVCNKAATPGYQRFTKDTDLIVDYSAFARRLAEIASPR